MANKNVKYSNHYVAGFCILPTCLVMCLFLSRITSVIWFLGIFATMYVTGMMYQNVVINENSKIAIWKRYWFLFFGQIVFWWVFIHIVSIT